ncbi:MAG: hypothetical protein U1U88_001386 [Lawsonella clevelandensis]
MPVLEAAADALPLRLLLADGASRGSGWLRLLVPSASPFWVLEVALLVVCADASAPSGGGGVGPSPVVVAPSPSALPAVSAPEASAVAVAPAPAALS